jgi:hypothetical protein
MKKLVTILAAALLCLGLGSTVFASPQTWTFDVRDRNVDPPLGTSYSVSYLNSCSGLLNITRTFYTRSGIQKTDGSYTYSGWDSKYMPVMSQNDMYNVYIDSSVNSNSSSLRTTAHCYKVTDGVGTDSKTVYHSSTCDTSYTLSLPY